MVPDSDLSLSLSSVAGFSFSLHFVCIGFRLFWGEEDFFHDSRTFFFLLMDETAERDASREERRGGGG